MDYVLPLAHVHNAHPKVNRVKAVDGVQNRSWVAGYSASQIRKLQERDTVIAHLLRWLEDNSVSDLDLHLSHPGTKSLWACKSQLKVVGGVLCYRWEDPPVQRTLLVVPKVLQSEVLRLCHNIPTAEYETFTELAYRFNFSDQPHFNKTYKNLTEHSPKKFFDKGTKLGKEDTFWHL